MAFIRLPGTTGKVYVPERGATVAKKHPCRDCYNCQLCSEDRCRLCRCRSVRKTGGTTPDAADKSGKCRKFHGRPRRGI
jgi:hypothetical protein